MAVTLLIPFRDELAAIATSDDSFTAISRTLQMDV